MPPPINPGLLLCNPSPYDTNELPSVFSILRIGCSTRALNPFVPIPNADTLLPFDTAKSGYEANPEPGLVRL